MSTTVRVSCPAGTIVGVSDGDVTRFHSIPYSDIPGDFANATRLAPQELIDATTYRPETIALSVVTPSTARPLADLPVVVYIHGGRFEYGTHGDRRADGTPNAHSGVVTVHIGYRVKLAGFARFHDDEPDRYRGIDDCQLGLEWVQRNIESFGGDPTNVTLVGQSAGATTALWLARRDHFRGGFRRVMAMSPCFPRASFAERKASLRIALGKPITRDALSRVSPKVLDRGYKRFRTFHGMDMALGPSPLDGHELASIPLWVTSTRDEFYHMPAGQKADSLRWREGIARRMSRRMGMTGSFDTWLEQARAIDPRRIVGRLIGDASNRRWVSQAAEETPGQVWMTEFVRTHGPAIHCSEIPVAFGLEPGPLHDLLLAFARGEELPWPAFSPDTGRQALRFNLETGHEELISDPLRMVREAFGA